MRHRINVITQALALILCSQFAHASVITITRTSSNGQQISDSSMGVLIPSPHIRGTINVYKKPDGTHASLTGHDGSSATLGYQTNRITGIVSFRSIAFNSPVQAISYDESNGDIFSQNLSGTIKIASLNNSNVFINGGEISIKDMRIDHQTKTVYATVTGLNGYGTRANVPFWNYALITGDQKFSGGKMKSTLTQLRLTADGLNAWAQSLGLNLNGRQSLTAVNNDPPGFGDMIITVNPTGTPPVDPDCVAP